MNRLLLFLLLSNGLFFAFTTRVSDYDEKEREKFQSFKNSLLQKTTSEAQRHNLENLLKNIFPRFANLPLDVFNPEYLISPTLHEERFDLTYQVGVYFQEVLLLASQYKVTNESYEFFINPKYFLSDQKYKSLFKELISTKGEDNKRFEWTLQDEKRSYSSLFKFYFEPFLEHSVYPQDKTSNEYKCLRAFLANIAAFGFLSKDVTGWSHGDYVPIPSYYSYNTFKDYLKDLAEFPKKVSQKNKRIQEFWKQGRKDRLKKIEKLSDKISETTHGVQELLEQIKKNRSRGESTVALELAHQEVLRKKEELEYKLKNSSSSLKYAESDMLREEARMKDRLRKLPLIIEMITDGTVRYFADQCIREKRSYFFKRMFLRITSYFADNPMIKMEKWWHDLINQLPIDNICRPSLQKTYEEYFGGTDQESQKQSTFERSLHEWLSNDFTPQEIDKMIFDIRKELQK